MGMGIENLTTDNADSTGFSPIEQENTPTAEDAKSAEEKANKSMSLQPMLQVDFSSLGA
jgi:hypothetical protein